MEQGLDKIATAAKRVMLTTCGMLGVFIQTPPSCLVLIQIRRTQTILDMGWFHIGWLEAAAIQ